MPFYYVTFTREFGFYIKADNREDCVKACSKLERHEIEDMCLGDAPSNWKVNVSSNGHSNTPRLTDIGGAISKGELVALSDLEEPDEV